MGADCSYKLDTGRAIAVTCEHALVSRLTAGQQFRSTHLTYVGGTGKKCNKLGRRVARHGNLPLQDLSEEDLGYLANAPAQQSDSTSEVLASSLVLTSFLSGSRDVSACRKLNLACWKSLPSATPVFFHAIK